jgi:lysophospholipase L1-like esterase
MMNITAVFLVLAGTAFAGVDYEAGKSVDLSKKNRFSTAVISESGTPVLQLKCKVEAGADNETTVAYYAMPFKGIEADSTGISFDVRGAGEPVLVSVMVAPDKSVHIGWEATFFAEGTDWKTVKIRWDQFSPNCKPWNPGRFVDGTPLEPDTLKFIAFGRGNQFNKDQPAGWAFDVRGIQTESVLPIVEVPKKVSTGLSRTRAIIKQKGHLNILMLGDSITMHGKDQTYGYHFAKKLEEQFGITSSVANAGIGGHTVRGGRVVLKRSLKLMPNPDLVFVMYGANDCKSVQTSGLTAESFHVQYGALIDDLRIATGGKTDIVVLTGVPRLNKERTETSGVVEPIVPGVHAVAKSRDLALVDTFPAFLKLTPERVEAYYKDTIHQLPGGQVFMGELAYEQILKQYLSK